MMEFSSKEEWKNYCFRNHKSYLKNRYFRRWINQKKVDIFNCSGLKEKEIRLITMTIKNALRLCSKGFKIRLRKQINPDFAVKNANIDGAKTLRMVKKARKKSKSCIANIFLVNKRAKSESSLLKFGDALTYVSDGVTIFTFDPKVRYPRRYFKDEVGHEVYHLLGFNIHHPDAEVKGYGKLPKCIMEYNAPSEKLCQKCKDGLLSFWEGIKNATKN
jgi:predicted Zn-dependent protease